MKQPTDEQIRGFWECYGFVFEEHNSRFEHWWTYYTPDDMKLARHERHQPTGYPPIDLNNLFKYAVPKAMEKKDVGFLKWDGQRDSNKYTIFNQGKRFTDTDDPALALFWALWQVKEASPT